MSGVEWLEISRKTRAARLPRRRGYEHGATIRRQRIPAKIHAVSLPLRRWSKSDSRKPHDRDRPGNMRFRNWPLAASLSISRMLQDRRVAASARRTNRGVDDAVEDLSSPFLRTTRRRVRSSGAMVESPRSAALTISKVCAFMHEQFAHINARRAFALIPDFTKPAANAWACDRPCAGLWRR